MKKTKQTEWQEAFRSHMTKVSFNITLTRAMMEMICSVADDVHWDRWRYGGLVYPNNFLATEHALEARGLIIRKPRIVGTEPKEGEIPWKLTPAGVAMIELMKVGGIFIEAEAAREKLKARKGRW